MKQLLKNFERSPQVYARIGGILYLVIIVAGMCGQLLVRSKLIVSGDAISTAHNIMNSELLWRVGIAADLIMHICDLPVMLILYFLLKPVNKKLALLNLLMNLIQTAVLVANKLNLVMVLFLLGNGKYLQTFNPNQLSTLSYLFIKLHDFGFGIGLIFFGFVCLMEGYLIFKSTYFPKAIGVLMAVAGISYLTNSFALLLAPQFANFLIMMPCLVAELSLSLWLIFKGVNVRTWENRVKNIT
jgi:Domain of unknown function (DUF4386)